jgi:hypothetical protein
MRIKSLLDNFILRTLGIVCLILGSGMIACHKSNKPYTPTPPACPEFNTFPPGINIEIMVNGKYIWDSNYLAQLQLINDSIHKPVDDFHVSSGVLCPDGTLRRFVTTVNAPLSSVFGSKLYYMVYPDGSKDVIYLDIVRTPATNCNYWIEGMLFNNIRPQTDSLLYIGYDSTYILNHL